MAQKGSRTFIINHVTKNLFLPELRKTFQLWEDIIEKGHAPFLTHAGFSRNQDSSKFGGIVPGGFGQSKGRATVYFSLVSPLDQNRDPKL